VVSRVSHTHTPLSAVLSGPDRAEGSELKALGAALVAIRRGAGDPSYRALAQRTKELSPSTISRMFKSTRVPTWARLNRLLQALGVPQAEIESEWYRRWVRVRTEADPTRPIAAPRTLLKPAVRRDAETCADCGAHVDNTTAHKAWHRRFDPLAMAHERRSRRVPADSPASARMALVRH
jgi:transcriptional regulator with XRE-family HTH domain